MIDINSSALSQIAVEQATGLSREVLRKWELRYGFPLPLRGARGQRLYRSDDLVRLQLVQRLLGQGLRPVHVVGLPLAQLQVLGEQCDVKVALTSRTDKVAALLAILVQGTSVLTLQNFVAEVICLDGLADFVTYRLQEFNQAVGQAWADGQVGLHAEHLYTETVRGQVEQALAHVPVRPSSLQVLLTTPPGELHSLGLLAVQTSLTLQGAACVSLGTQTPVANVVQAAAELGVRVVAISISACMSPEAVRAYVSALRQQLGPDCLLWVGGQGAQALVEIALAQVEVFDSVVQVVAAWQTLVSPVP